MRRFPAALAAVVLAILIGMAVPCTALAAPVSLDVSVDRPLSLLEDPLQVTVRGDTACALQECRLLLRIEGPAALSQLRQTSPALPEAGKVEIVLGQASSGEVGLDGASYKTGSAGELAQGALEAQVTLPSSIVSSAGAYLVVVEVRRSTEIIALGQTWVGKVPRRREPIDLAVVWPAFLGIHRDAEGVFFDRTLEQAVAHPSEGEGDLRALLLLPERFPDWSFTLAPEPALLAQLRDMTDGYLCRDDSGTRSQVAEKDTPAQDAGQILELFREAAGRDSVEVAVAPFALPDLGALSARDWRDGLEQVQWGKQEVLETLGLQSPPRIGCPFGLALTSDSLACFAEASVDLVVVDRGLLGLVAEPVPEEAVAVRVRDARNDRVTLVLADSGLSSLVDEPWDVGVFCAGLAAELAEEDRPALVVAPCRKYGLVPEEFLQGVGEAIDGLEWLHTQTLTSLVQDHLEDTRPLLLAAQYASRTGYIDEVIWENLEEAHAAVTTLGAAADPVHDPVETAYRWLYLAESSWWTQEGVTPVQASVGVEYAEKARELAREELGKLRVVALDHPTVFGREGVVKLTLDNQAGYALRLELRMEGDGLVFPDGETKVVELAPGLSTLTVPVRESEGFHRLEVELVAGEDVLARAGVSVRFVTISSVLPWLILAVLGLGTTAFMLVRWVLGRRRMTHPSSRSQTGRRTA